MLQRAEIRVLGRGVRFMSCTGPSLGLLGWNHHHHLALASAGSLGVLRVDFWEGCQEEGAGGSKEKAKAQSRGHLSPESTPFWCLVWLYSGPEQLWCLGSVESIRTQVLEFWRLAGGEAEELAASFHSDFPFNPPKHPDFLG